MIKFFIVLLFLLLSFVTQSYSCIFLAVDKKVLFLLETIKQQGHTIIGLQQQILAIRSPNEYNPDDFQFQLPLRTVEELELVNTHMQDTDVKSKLVNKSAVQSQSVAL